MQKNILNNIFKPKQFQETFEAFEKNAVKNALAEISSVFISATPNSKNNANLKVCGANQRIGYKSDAYGEDAIVEFDGK